jgi:HlyD family secretion protein
VITAPFDGVMEGVSVDVGSSAVMASSNSSSALGTIVTDKKLAQATVNESDIVKMKIGQKVTVSFDAIDGLKIEGTIVEINTLSTVTSGVVTYKVKVAFDTDDVRILPNMTVSLDVLTDSKDDVLYVPNQAVKHDASGYYVEKDASTTNFASSSRRFGNASSGMMFSTGSASSTPYRGNFRSSTRQRTGRATSSATSGAPTTLKKVYITIGIQTDKETEITSGLSEGDSVVLKQITTTGKAAASAPSITSFLRPQGAARTGAGSGNFRPGQ